MCSPSRRGPGGRRGPPEAPHPMPPPSPSNSRAPRSRRRRRGTRLRGRRRAGPSRGSRKRSRVGASLPGTTRSDGRTAVAPARARTRTRSTGRRHPSRTEAAANAPLRCSRARCSCEVGPSAKSTPGTVVDLDRREPPGRVDGSNRFHVDLVGAYDDDAIRTRDEKNVGPVRPHRRRRRIRYHRRDGVARSR